MNKYKKMTNFSTVTLMAVSIFGLSSAHADVVAPSITSSVSDAVVVTSSSSPSITDVTNTGVVSVLIPPATTTVATDTGATTVQISTTSLSTTTIPTTTISTDTGAQVISSAPGVTIPTDTSGGATVVTPAPVTPTPQPVAITTGGGGSSYGSYSSYSSAPGVTIQGPAIVNTIVPYVRPVIISSAHTSVVQEANGVDQHQPSITSDQISVATGVASATPVLNIQTAAAINAGSFDYIWLGIATLIVVVLVGIGWWMFARKPEIK